MIDKIVHDPDMSGFWHFGSPIPRESDIQKHKSVLKARNDRCSAAISRILTPGPNDGDVPSCAASVTPDANGTRVE